MRMLGVALVLLYSVLSSRCVEESDVNAQLAGESHFGGDILLTDEQRATMEATANVKDPFAPQNAVVRRVRYTWAGGVVPYAIDDSLGEKARDAINEAVSTYTEQTCIRFIPRTSERDFVRFYKGSGCLSYIGRIGGPQTISIGGGCAYKGIVMHEMFHALGRWHEQSRPDRDIHVQIKTENMRSGVEGNFRPVSSAFVTTQGVPYDLTSIMHYGAYAFSRNGNPTIVPRTEVELSIMGQRNGFSERDLEHINALYCGDDSSGPEATWSPWGAWSACSQSCNGGTRRRMRECLHGSSCPDSNIATELCNTNPCTVRAVWGEWGEWSGCSATCGGGRQTRLRRCINGHMCVGRSTEFRDCNTRSCPQLASWSPWGSWGACSQSCGGGSRQRQRTCTSGSRCPGAGMEVELCNSNVPCTSQPIPASREWSEWSECTKSCGGGTRFRVRDCGRSSCDSQQEACNTQDCNSEPDLKGLAHLGCFFVPRFSSALGLLEGTTHDLSDNPTTRRDPIRKCGSTAQRLGFNYFAVSAGYCISQSNDVNDYRYIPSSICDNGVGGYINGYFVMDVYEITNMQAFQDSAGIFIHPSSTIDLSSSDAELLTSTRLAENSMFSTATVPVASNAPHDVFLAGSSATNTLPLTELSILFLSFLSLVAIFAVVK